MSDETAAQGFHDLDQLSAESDLEHGLTVGPPGPAHWQHPGRRPPRGGGVGRNVSSRFPSLLVLDDDLTFARATCLVAESRDLGVAVFWSESDVEMAPLWGFDLAIIGERIFRRLRRGASARLLARLSDVPFVVAGDGQPEADEEGLGLTLGGEAPLSWLAKASGAPHVLDATLACCEGLRV